MTRLPRVLVLAWAACTGVKAWGAQPAAVPPDWENPARHEHPQRGPAGDADPVPDAASASSEDPQRTPFVRSLDGGVEVPLGPQAGGPARRTSSQPDFDDSAWRHDPRACRTSSCRATASRST